MYLWLIKWRNGCKWLFQLTVLPSKMLYMVWMSWHNHLRINVLQKPSERFTFKTCSQFSSIVQLSGLINEKTLDHFISFHFILYLHGQVLLHIFEIFSLNLRCPLLTSIFEVSIGNTMTEIMLKNDGFLATWTISAC
jgi:hypothetical protein